MYCPCILTLKCMQLKEQLMPPTHMYYYSVFANEAGKAGNELPHHYFLVMIHSLS